MALQILNETIILKNGLIIENPYIHIKDTKYIKRFDKFILGVSVYKDKEARDAGKEPLDGEINGFKEFYELESFGIDAISALLYTHLKTLPEFAKAIDC